MCLPLDQRYLKDGLYGSAVAKYFYFLGRLDVDSHTATTLPEPKSTIRWYMLSPNRKLPWQDKSTIPVGYQPFPIKYAPEEHQKVQS